MHIVVVLIVSVVLGLAFLRMRSPAKKRAAIADGLQPTNRTPLVKGRVDEPDQSMIWYEAGSAQQIPHVRGEWDRRTAKMTEEGRMFLVPGRGGCTTWDHLDTWSRLAEGLETRTHYLRIVHNHWRHDMDNDAIVLEFMTSTDRDTFQSRIPEGGPTPFDMRRLIGTEGAHYLEEMLERNRTLTDRAA